MRGAGAETSPRTEAGSPEHRRQCSPLGCWGGDGAGWVGSSVAISPCANFRSFSSCQNISSVPFNGNSHFPFTVPGNYPSTFCLYESDHSRCFILSGIIQYFSFPGRFILPSRLSTRPSLLYRVLEFPFFLMVSNALLWVPTILAYEWKTSVALVLWLL